MGWLPSPSTVCMQDGANKTIRAAEAGMGAAVGLAARGLLPDSSVPTTAAAGPSTSVQHASLREVVSQPRAVDRLSTTIGNGQHFQPGGERICASFLCFGRPRMQSSS